jgi:hypothetical protein
MNVITIPREWREAAHAGLDGEAVTQGVAYRQRM